MAHARVVVVLLPVDLVRSKKLAFQFTLIMAGPGGSKRSLDEDEFECVSDMHMSKSAKLHGVLMSLSPIKNTATGARKYFHGQLTDGKKRARLVGFDAKIHG